ncbi:MAG: hypothetical protein ABWZ91_03030 [Nocardioides sp.]
MLAAAEARLESRGSHLRTDFPATHAWWQRRVAVRLDEAGVPRATVRSRQERAA